MDETASETPNETSVMYMVGRINQGIRREMTERLRPWEVSVQQYTAMSVLNARPGLSNAQLARRALVTPQSMIEIVAKLERRGFVRRAADGSHATILRAQITPRGRELLDAVDPTICEIQNDLLAPMSSTQREIFLKTMLATMERLSAAQHQPRAL